jgi:hypothetical protein
MPAMTDWDELSRLEQRLIMRLYGGGSVRNQSLEAIAHLHGCGLISDEGELTTSGVQVFMIALRRQQADVRQCARIAA